jgi:hypothetical protein
MEAARTSETSVDIELRTRQYIPEDSELHHRLSQHRTLALGVEHDYHLRDEFVYLKVTSKSDPR